MPQCPFCTIAAGGDPEAAIAYRNERLVAFADHAPIRPGHMQIVPLAHVETFEQLAPELLAEIAALGQRIARAQKAIYGVARVGFAFTGHDVPHVHAHVVPLHSATDITSARYFDEELRVSVRPRPAVADLWREAGAIGAWLADPARGDSRGLMV